MMCVRIFSVLWVIIFAVGCAEKCSDPQACLSEASELYQKAEASKDKVEKFTLNKRACSKVFMVFKAHPDLLNKQNYQIGKWACFNIGDGTKTETLAKAEEGFGAKVMEKKR